jgi:crossover junction endodeoxyribonuclease RuvC
MTLVLGIDPGTATTGYGLVREREDGSLESLAYGTILTPAGVAAHQRLSMLFHQLSELLLLHRPDSCAVEKLFFQSNVRLPSQLDRRAGWCCWPSAKPGWIWANIPLTR